MIKKINRTPLLKINYIRNVNFMESNIDWTILTDITKDKIKNTLCEEESTEEIKQFIKLLQGISLETLPRKNKSGKEKGTPWEIKTIKNRIKILKR